MKRLVRQIVSGWVVSIIVVGFSGSSFAQGTLHTLLANGPQDRRINIVILSEGYTSAQETQFVVNAGSILSSLLSVSPWSEYSSYVNGFALFVASVQSGSDDPSESVFRNTYFNSTFDSYASDRLLTIPPNDHNSNYADGYGKVYALLASYMPSYDIVLILVNDQQYGGSGGTFAISSLDASASDIVIHELGHSHAKLGDEYASSYPGYPDIEEPNTTQQTARELIKWSTWILPATPIPTPATASYGSSVGLFEGAHYHSTNWYRPMLQCKMKSLDVDFCPVCSQTHVLAHYALVSPIDSLFPLSTLVAIQDGEEMTLRIVPKRPSSHSLAIRWYDDGILLPTITPTAVFSAGNLAIGVNTIKCVVIDTTSLVRVDPLHRLRDSAMWTVTVGTTCGCACHGDPNCDGTVLDILDVIQMVDLTFRAGQPNSSPGCEYVDADLDCNGVVDVVDIVHAINVSFRNALPSIEFCDPCQ